MANRFLNNIRINDEYTLPSADGSANQIIITDGAGNLSFVDTSTIAVGEAEQVHIACKNTSGVAISKGDPVYITGTVGTSYIVQIAKADASNSAKMPAVGLAESDLAINAEGFVIVSGVLKNLTTDPLSTGDGTPSSNDTVYVKAGGGLTRTKPTGSGNLIQNVGKVGRVSSANSGSLAVSTIMRTNDVPNLTTGKIWVGSSTYTTESGVVHLDEANGRMGIGTPSPNTKLHIVGAGSNSEAIYLFGDSNYGATIHYDRGGSYAWRTGVGGSGSTSSIPSSSWGVEDVSLGVIRLVIAHTSGNVGIGTTSPLARLHVFNSGYPQLNLESNAGSWQVGVSTGNDFAIRKGSTGSVYPLWIDNNENVGIGTTSPHTKLTINDSNVAGQSQLAIGDISGYHLAMGHNSAGNTDGFIGTVYDNDAARFDIRMKGTAQSDAKVTVLGTGDVGIGTTNPGAKLDVRGSLGYLKFDSSGSDGTIKSDYNLKLYADDTGDNSSGFQNMQFFTAGANERMRIDSAGNVGIGTTSPDSKLDVTGGNITINTLGTTFAYFKYGAVGSETLRGSITTDGIDLKINATADLLLLPTGNVGIGTTSPAQKLHVYGKIKLEEANGGTVLSGNYGYFKVSPTNNYGVLVENSGDTSKYFSFGVPGDYGQIRYRENTGTAISVTATGVGIGTTSPGAKLHVSSGEIRVDAGQAITLDVSNSMYLVGAQNQLRLYNGGNPVFNITNTGNVGIGTTSPNTKLKIEGDTPILQIRETSGDAEAGISINHAVSGNHYNWFIGTLDGNARKLTIGATVTDGWSTDTAQPAASLFLIDYLSGNVGIGTTSPDTPLDVSSESSTIASFRATGGVSNNKRLEVGSGGDRTIIKSFIDTTDAASALAFSNGNSEAMRIDSSGNVGIGTASPGYKLDVSGQIRVDNGVGNGSGQALIVGGSGDATFTSGGSLFFGAYDYGNSTYIRGYDNSAGFYFYADGTLTMNIAGNGNVGIGTTSPGKKLHVYSSANEVAFFQGTSGGAWIDFQSSTSNLWSMGAVDANGMGFYNRTTASYPLVIKNGGNVGIGEYSPTQKLHVGGNIRVTGAYYDSNNSAGTSGQVLSSTATGTDWVSLSEISGVDGTGTANYIAKWSDSDTITNSVIYDDGTNVGIGTPSPTVALDVNGDIAIRGGETADDARMYFRASDNSNRFTIETDLDGTTSNDLLGFRSVNADNILVLKGNGNVGIGTTNPGAKLQINDASAAKARFLDTTDFYYTDYGRDGIDAYSNANASAPIFFKTGGSERMRIAADGSVLVNTTSSAMTGISGAADIAQFKSNGSLGHIAISDSGNILEFSRNSTNYIVSSGTSSSFAFDIGGTERMRINSSGNIGIGTTNPSRKLTIGGIGNTGDGLKIEDPTNTDYGAHLTYYDAGSEVWLGGITNNVYNDTLSIHRDATRTITVDINNNVGIGTTSPQVRLTLRREEDGSLFELNRPASGVEALYGGIVGNDPYFYSNNGIFTLGINNPDGGLGGEVSYITMRNGTTRYTTFEAGNVGIGTTSPSYKLEVNNTTNENIARFYRDSNSATSISHLVSTGRPQTRYAYDSYTSWYIGNNLGTFGIGSGYLASTPAILNITSTGDVGIGETNPSYKLHATGGALVGGKVSYVKNYSSLDTTGNAVAGIDSSFNGASAMFTFTCFGHVGGYQKIVYSCYNAGGTWNTKKVIDEGTNDFDIEASANAATITFTFKSTSGTKSYSPKVVVEAAGSAINSTYA